MGISGVSCNLNGFTCLANKLEDSHFPPHKQLIEYDPQIMWGTADLDLVSQHLTITILLLLFEFSQSPGQIEFESQIPIFCDKLLDFMHHYLNE